MLSKFTLTCKVCGCKMQFAPRGQELQTPIICQNCSQPLSENDSFLMKNAMDALRAIEYESVINGCYIPEQKGFKFEIEISPSPFTDSED